MTYFSYKHRKYVNMFLLKFIHDLPKHILEYFLLFYYCFFTFSLCVKKLKSWGHALHQFSHRCCSLSVFLVSFQVNDQIKANERNAKPPAAVSPMSSVVSVSAARSLIALAYISSFGYISDKQYPHGPNVSKCNCSKVFVLNRCVRERRAFPVGVCPLELCGGPFCSPLLWKAVGWSCVWITQFWIYGHSEKEIKKKKTWLKAASWGCYNKLPETGWLQQQKFTLRVQEARRSKPRRWELLLAGVSEGECTPRPFLVSTNVASLTNSWIMLIFAQHRALTLCVCHSVFPRPRPHRWLQGSLGAIFISSELMVSPKTTFRKT